MSVCEAGLQPISGILMTKTEPVKPVAFTDYRDDDSDFEDEPDNEPEDYEMVPEPNIHSGVTLNGQPENRGRSDSVVIVKSEHPRSGLSTNRLSRCYH